jgi:all-trans-8'-apo-beta-carotenal 15,15'-oxygenase
VKSDGSLCLQVVRYEDWQTNQWLAEVVSGQLQTPAAGLLWQMQFDLNQQRLVEAAPLSDLRMEFPVLPMDETGQVNKHLYLSAHDRADAPVEAMFNSIARVDIKTGTVSLGRPGSQCYPSEPVLAQDHYRPDQQWLLTVVYDAQAHASTVQIYDPAGLEAGPVCMLGLPSVVPFGFHGTWQGGYG